MPRLAVAGPLERMASFLASVQAREESVWLAVETSVFMTVAWGEHPLHGPELQNALLVQRPIRPTFFQPRCAGASPAGPAHRSRLGAKDFHEHDQQARVPRGLSEWKKPKRPVLNGDGGRVVDRCARGVAGGGRLWQRRLILTTATAFPTSQRAGR